MSAKTLPTYGREPEVVDPATVACVDDVTKRLVHPPSGERGQALAKDLAVRSIIAAKCLGKAVQEHGDYAMNATKTESLLCLNGLGVHAAIAEMHNKDAQICLEGRPKRVMRLLGGLLRGDGKTNEETEARIQAARTGYWSMRRIWSRVPKDAREAFICLVDGNIFSGLEMRMVLPGQVERLNKVRLSFLRRIMRGKATLKYENEDGEVIAYRRISKEDVYKYKRLEPAEIALRHRRLKCYRMWAKHPATHKQLVAAMLGQIEALEPEPTINSERELTADANDLAKRMLSDIYRIAEQDDSMANLVDEYGGSVVSKSFQDPECRRLFIAIDCDYTKAKYHSVAVPPPDQPRDGESDVGGKLDTEGGESGASIVCDLCAEQGRHAAIPTSRQLVQHARWRHNS